mgnify:FL=1|jgi:fucose 4-O-acetylase-like acetyltransferase
MSDINERSYLIDNLKGLMIVFVVIGHFFDIWAGKYFNIRFIYTFIYLFHMPCFVFISGYLTKDPEKSRGNAFEKLLVPYIVMSILWKTYCTIFSIVLHGYSSKLLSFSILNPAYGLWYLQALFIWRYFLKDILRIKYALWVSISLSLLVGTVNEFGTVLSMSRVIVYLPFFLAGYYVRQNNYLPEMLSMPKKHAWVIVFITGCVALLLSLQSNSLFRYLFYYNSYRLLGLNDVVGIITRAMTLFVGLMMTAALFNILPDKETKLVQVGRNSMVVYIGHFYIAYYFHNMFYNLNEFNILLLGSILIFITILLLSSESASKIYNKLMNNILNIIFIKRPVN